MLFRDENIVFHVAVSVVLTLLSLSRHDRNIASKSTAEQSKAKSTVRKRRAFRHENVVTKDLPGWVIIPWMTQALVCASKPVEGLWFLLTNTRKVQKLCSSWQRGHGLNSKPGAPGAASRLWKLIHPPPQAYRHLKCSTITHWFTYTCPVCPMSGLREGKEVRLWYRSIYQPINSTRCL